MCIKRGEIWRVNLDPTRGTEIRKTRPAVVINSDWVGTLPIRLVAPLTEWKHHFEHKIWLVKLVPDRTNGLTKPSVADILQLRGVDTRRLSEKVGSISETDMRSIVSAIAAIIDY